MKDEYYDKELTLKAVIEMNHSMKPFRSQEGFQGWLGIRISCPTSAFRPGNNE